MRPKLELLREETARAFAYATQMKLEWESVEIGQITDFKVNQFLLAFVL